jgi:hypothetical protein
MSISYCERSYFKSQNFLGAASEKLFADDIEKDLRQSCKRI